MKKFDWAKHGVRVGVGDIVHSWFSEVLLRIIFDEYERNCTERGARVSSTPVESLMPVSTKNHRYF